ncbi:MAG: LysM peptidoglycan-binding domain-containing protein, partial [Chloroflexota bacterium]
MKSLLRIFFSAFLIATLLYACASPTDEPGGFPTYDPFLPLGGDAVPTPIVETGPGTFVFATPTEMPFIVPTAVPLGQLIPTFRPVGQPFLTPTPDGGRQLPTARTDAQEYVVQPGDTLGEIAAAFGVGVDALMEANGLTDADVLVVGQTLIIPVVRPQAAGSSFKIIPDSELVYGPASAPFDVEKFIKERGGFLSIFAEDVNGEYLTAAQIVTLVSRNYSVNPRLLLALVEYRSGWLTNPSPAQIDYALNIPFTPPGLYRQLTYAANELNRGYYLWRVNAVSSWVLADGTVVPAEAGVNAGTAGVQNFFAKLDDLATWTLDVSEPALDRPSFYQTYFLLFGRHPFEYAVEPVVPTWLHQPRMALPFERGVPWVFTGGPHGGWDSGSAWAALDFSPVVEDTGCFTTDTWVTAMTDGLIIRTGNGQALQDLDGDGYEQTGWVILYMHIETRDRVAPGTRVRGGERIGHP